MQRLCLRFLVRPSDEKRVHFKSTLQPLFILAHSGRQLGTPNTHLKRFRSFAYVTVFRKQPWRVLRVMQLPSIDHHFGWHIGWSSGGSGWIGASHEKGSVELRPQRKNGPYYYCGTSFGSLDRPLSKGWDDPAGMGNPMGPKMSI